MIRRSAVETRFRSASIVPLLRIRTSAGPAQVVAELRQIVARHGFPAFFQLFAKGVGEREILEPQPAQLDRHSAFSGAVLSRQSDDHKSRVILRSPYVWRPKNLSVGFTA